MPSMSRRQLPTLQVPNSRSPRLALQLLVTTACTQEVTLLVTNTLTTRPRIGLQEQKRDTILWNKEEEGTLRQLWIKGALNLDRCCPDVRSEEVRKGESSFPLQKNTTTSANED